MLLAAGDSSRFGSNKLIHPLPDGTPVALAAAGNLLAAVPQSIAIIRQGQQQLGDGLSALGLQVVENPLADQGMGSSLAAGINASRDADGWLIALADMPWIRPETITALVGRLNKGASMVAPVYRQVRGHPVGLSSRWRDDLLGLHADRGARQLLNDHPDELELIATSDPGVIRDIDLPEDLLGSSLGV